MYPAIWIWKLMKKIFLRKLKTGWLLPNKNFNEVSELNKIIEGNNELLQNNLMALSNRSLSRTNS